MKIVSLQSVGLGDIGIEISGRAFAKPIRYEVGEGVAKPCYFMTGNEPKVTKITHLSDYLTNKDANDIIPDYYKVHTSDGHIRVLPADKYIADWSE
ncbi:hypothetical protein [Leuconostoc mesenteroides]|uniref:hypothetical protein n=1 Tax=Leuconostoc mesenteroides TaxID=1245 RepID=UPI002360C5DE|nr:hypothetical protein [Leuconostoc mesenteroides]